MTQAPRHFRRAFGAVLLLGAAVASGCAALPAAGPDAGLVPAKYGAVATVNPYATRAAIHTLEAGGNAVDAAVAAMLTLGVVDGHNSGIGGGCFLLIRTADGRSVAIDARETAPALATPGMYLRNGKPDTTLSQTGPLAVATPGALAGYDHAVRTFGRLSLAKLLRPAADLAETGFPIDAAYASKLDRTRRELGRFAAPAELLLPNGTQLKKGDLLRQPDLARTYRAIADTGIDYFYRGPFATAVEEYMRNTGGVLRAGDFADYRIVLRRPLESTYRGYTVLGMPPPSSGGLHVAQILAMLERFDLARLSEADRLTTIANAMSLAFADRAYFLGDPAFTNVPKGLLDPEYLAGRSALVSSTAALRDVAHGSPADQPAFDGRDDPDTGRHTTHVSVADAMGNVVSVTATINTAFGSKVIVPGTGVFLNNEMDDFAVAPGTPNAFGLVGSDANAVAPGKRPLSSMSPTIILKNGRPRYVIGAAGGPRIITQVACVMTNLIDLQMTPQAAMAASRIHHQWRPDPLWIEESAFERNAGLKTDLANRGFRLDVARRAGATNLVVIGAAGMEAVSEPRADGEGLVR